jgi:hypothetical protein
MAGKNSDLREAEELLKKIKKLYSEIGLNNPFDGSKAKDFIGKIDELKDGLEDANDILHDMDGGIGDLVKSWRSINDEVGTYNKTTTSSKSALSSLTSITEKLKDHQKGINGLSSKELENLHKKFQSNKDILKSNQSNLASEIKSLQNKSNLNTRDIKQLSQLQNLHKNIQGLLEEDDSIMDETLKKLEKESNLTKEIEKKTGVLGGVLKGISKIPILGDIFDANEALEASKTAIRETGGAVNGLGAAFKNIGQQITGGVLNPANMVLGAITFIITTLKDIDKGAGEFAKNMNISYSEALATREEMAYIATSSGDAALSSQKLMQSQMEIGKALGTNALLNESDLKTMTKLVNQSGLQYDELMGIQKLSLVNGKTLEQNSKEILGGAKAYASRNKIVVNEKEVLKEVNKSSKSLQLSLGQNTKAIAESVIKAKQFGLTLEEAEKISSSLLDFESSIENELSAELLTGKNLNFEKARQLSLEGDIAGAASEVASQMGSAADFGKMNVIQQEAIAKSIGMSREDLAKSLIEKEALAKIGAQDAEEARKKYDALVQQFGVEEAQKKLGDETLANQFEQQSNTEKFAQAVEKIKDIFVTIVDGPLGAMLEGLSTLLSSSTAIYSITGAIAGLYAGKMLSGVLALMKAKKAEKALSFGAAAIDIIKGAWSSLGGLPVVGPVLAGAAIAGGIALTSKYNSMQDGVIGPGGEMVVSGPKGSIQLDKDDSIVAGTNLFGDKSQSNTSGQPQQQSSTSVNVDMSQTNALLQQLITIISAGGDVIMDGQKVGQALNLVAYKTQ